MENPECREKKGTNRVRLYENHGVRKSSRRLTCELLALDERLSVGRLGVLEDGRSVADGGGDLLGVVELEGRKSGKEEGGGDQPC